MEKKMYIITEWNGLEYEDFEEKIIGVFDTKEKAEKVKAFLEENQKEGYFGNKYKYYIEEYNLNTFEYNLENYKINKKISKNVLTK